MKPHVDKLLVLFDGECVLCHRIVRFILRHDRARKFLFAPLDSDEARQALREAGLDEEQCSVILIRYDADGAHAYKRSSATWRIYRHLPYPWKLVAATAVVPRPLRDLGYKLISKTRTRIWGKSDMQEFCETIPPEWRKRVLPH